MVLLVVHVVRDLDIASGGPSRSVPALAESEARQPGVEVVVLCRDRGKPRVALGNGKVQYLAVAGSQRALARALRRVLAPGNSQFDGRVLHLHGLWSPAIHFAARTARRQGVPYVVSARGMLAPWALGHKAWKKNLAWKLYQRKDLAGAHCLLASSAFEHGDIAALLPGARTEVIPHGCEEPPAAVDSGAALPGGDAVRWALALGRLHPVKGFAELIEAWASLRPAGWKLAIAGPDENGYRAKLEALVSKHGLQGTVHFCGPVGDQEKWALLYQCELFVAPSRTENFGMAIAEALQSGTPVITTRGTPWSELPALGAGWWIDKDVAALGQALAEATRASSDALREMGRKGRALIREKYTWERVARQSVGLYRSILQASRT